MGQNLTSKRIGLPFGLGLEDLLIALFLVTTINHIASYLLRFEREQLKFVAYCMAGGIEIAIARSSYLYRIYRGRKQKAWALISLSFFCALSLTFQYFYFQLQGAGVVASVALSAIAPVGIFLLSYLRGIRTVSERTKAQRRKRKKKKEQVKQAETPPTPLSDEQETIIGMFQDEPETSLATLASHLDVSKSTASRRVRELVELGYLRRNGRQVEILEDGHGTDETTT